MTREELEIASEYYAHNNFEMHETNSYKELKRGFKAGAKHTNQRVIEELDNIPRLKTPLGEEIRLSYHYVLRRIKQLNR